MASCYACKKVVSCNCELTNGLCNVCRNMHKLLDWDKQKRSEQQLRSNRFKAK